MPRLGDGVVMAMNDSADTDDLLNSAAEGDARAIQQLLERHAARLREMVAIRLDPRRSALLTPSDIVRETLADAAVKLDAYLRERPLPFYPWLHRLAAERVAVAYHHHLMTHAGSTDREQSRDLLISHESVLLLVDRLVDSGTSPSHHLFRDELRQQVRAALARLAANDREVLVMCYIERLSFDEIAAILGITENAAKVRHFRALRRIRKLLEPLDLEEPPR